MDAYEIAFPEGDAEVERLPEAFTIRNPRDADDVWVRQEVACRTADGRLVVTVRRRAGRARAERFDADIASVLREWNRRAASDRARTVQVRTSPSRRACGK